MRDEEKVRGKKTRPKKLRHTLPVKIERKGTKKESAY